MATNEYVFLSNWRLEGSCEDVFGVLGNPLDLARWWPEVYLAVEQTKDASAGGVGNEFRLLTKGWLPYKLRWEFRVTEVEPPSSFALEAWGDLVGTGRWTFRQDGKFVDAIYEWRVRADKPLLRYLSFLLKPLFASNHRWAMARGEEALRRELKRLQQDRKSQT